MFVGQEVGLMKDCQPSEMLGIPLLTMGESNMRSTIHTTSRHEHGMQTWTLANMSSFGPETPFLLAVLGPGEQYTKSQSDSAAGRSDWGSAGSDADTPAAARM